MVSMNFLELEYWLDTDFKMLNGLPTNDPFDAFNFYQYSEEPHTPLFPGNIGRTQNAALDNNPIPETMGGFQPPG